MCPNEQNQVGGDPPQRGGQAPGALGAAVHKRIHGTLRLQDEVSASSNITKIRDAENLARLRLDVSPPSVEVFIDRRKVHVGAPVEIQTSAKVSHQLMLRCGGFDDFSTTFSLEPGEVRDLQIILPENPALLPTAELVHAI